MHNLRRLVAALARWAAYKTAASAMCCDFEPPLPATQISTRSTPEVCSLARHDNTTRLPRPVRHEAQLCPSSSTRRARQPVSASR